jgi:hypothetical protein
MCLVAIPAQELLDPRVSEPHLGFDPGDPLDPQPVGSLDGVSQ